MDSHYKSNMKDLEFNLFEVHRIQDHFGSAPFEQMDEDTARAILREIERLAREEFAASFIEADRTPLVLDEDHEVHLPASMHRSLEALYGGGWHRLGLAPEMGGFGATPTLFWAAQEMLLGANPTAFFYASGPLFARILFEEGTEEQKAWARIMVDKHWAGTMVLTEPDAGSDVGAGTTKALHIEGDVYHLEGVKRFITGGEHDFGDNIIHLVLARPEGAVPGSKGLSMFAVPKFLINEDGTLGARNGIYATNVEEKMGLKGSSTCELTLGLDGPCQGWLVGGVHDGIRQMFRVIENARMTIGMKSAATLSTGYLNALAYAQERVQGADMTKATDKTAPRVAIINHPNVRAMLMRQKAYAEGLRALVMYAAWVQDQVYLHPDDQAWDRRNDLLLPLVKGYSSETAYRLLADSLQVLGGSGYTQDYPIEQYIRDAKIDTVYEGTTGIQGLDLFFRKIVRDQGEGLTALATEILEFVKAGTGDDELAVERTLLGEMLEAAQAQVGAVVGHVMGSVAEPTEIYKAGLHTTGVLETLAEVVIGWQLLRHAEVAMAVPDQEPFHQGKVAAARYFMADVAPKIAARKEAAASEDGALMTLPPEAF